MTDANRCALPRSIPASHDNVATKADVQAIGGGRLLAEMDAGGRKWEVLSLPMEAEADDPLGRARVGRCGRNGSGPIWSRRPSAIRALGRRCTQQRPAPDTGTYFERDWLRPANSIPPREDMRTYGASDYAVTANDGDWTVHVIIGVDPDSRLWLLDLWRGQTASTCAALISTC